MEEVTADFLDKHAIPFQYETLKIPFVQPEQNRKYTPDFILLDNGIIVETKGRWQTADRKKMCWIIEQHPHLDIRIVFGNARARISKRSKTTYAKYCDMKGITWAHRTIPEEWLKERPRKKVLEALRALGVEI